MAFIACSLVISCQKCKNQIWQKQNINKSISSTVYLEDTLQFYSCEFIILIVKNGRDHRYSESWKVKVSFHIHSSISLGFCGPSPLLRHWDATSICVQFENKGREL